MAAQQAPEPEKPRVESPSISLPPPKKSRAKVLAFVIPLVVVVVGGGLIVQSQMKASKTERAEPVTSVEPPPPPPPPAPEPPPPPTAAAEPPPSASAAKKPAASAGAAGAAPVLSADPTKTAYIDTSPLPPGRKIIVDGRQVGRSPQRVVVRCGNHTVQIGDLAPENIHFPCGGEVTFTD